MKHRYLFLIFFLLVAHSSMAQVFTNTTHRIQDPIFREPSRQGNIRDIHMEVTPQGLYAKIELTFTLTVSKSFNRSGYMMESVLFFELPPGSYIHDSWLWLDELHIISAEVVERNKGISTYEGIVKRQRDPSLLINVLPTVYKLSVYPIQSDYPRKVKISFSVPFNWNDGYASLPLPANIFRTSEQPAEFNLSIQTDSVFKNPSFLHHTINKYINSQNGVRYNLSIPAEDYQYDDLILRFTIPDKKKGMLYVHQTAPGMGVYQVMVPAEKTFESAPPRHINFVIEGGSGSIYSMEEITRMLATALRTELRPTDFFNIFYREKLETIQMGKDWLPADSTTIANTIKKMPADYVSIIHDYTHLYKQSLSFTQKTPDARTIILGGGNFWTADGEADSIINEIKKEVGPLTHQINVILNNGANPEIPIFKKLAKATGGSFLNTYSKSKDDLVMIESFDFDIPNHLKTIIRNAPTTNSFNISLPIDGFVVHESELAYQGKYSPYDYITQTGYYYGNWQKSGDVTIDYLNNGNIVKSTIPLMEAFKGNRYTYKGWVFNYVKILKNYGQVSEIIDSCIGNRLLCDYTAFLALETGDTITVLTSMPNSGSGGGSWGSIADVDAQGTFKVFPNPFSSGNLTIQCSALIREIQILDITGRLIWKAAPNEKTVYWNGTGLNGAIVSSGLYTLVVIDEHGRRHITKIEKQ